MPTTTTTTTATGASGTTTTTSTETRTLLQGIAKCSLVVQAPAEAVLPLITFSTLIPSSPLAAIITQEVSDGDNVGSVRTLKGIPGGPFDGKVIKETCIDTSKGHTYNLDLGEYGSPTYALPAEVEAYQGTFSCEEINASTCVLSWCAHYQTSDPVMLKGLLEEMIGGALVAIAEAATASGGPAALTEPAAAGAAPHWMASADDSWSGGGAIPVDPVGPRGGGKRWILRARPEGDIKDSDLEMVEEPIPEPADGEVMIQNILISIDPTHRIWMSEIPQYMPSVGLDTCMRAGTVGKVVKSKSDSLAVGTIVTAFGGVQEYFVDAAAAFNPVADPSLPLGMYHSVLSMVIGHTAWIGTNICDPKEGDTMLVSGAAGAVGSIACQLAKLRGARVVGIAGSAEKIAFLESIGCDGTINYKEESIVDGLARAAPNGINCYFDNVGGETLEAAIGACKNFARIAFCGAISAYNDDLASCGPKNFQMVLMRRIKMQGFICVDHVASIGESMELLAGLLKEGKLKFREHIEETWDYIKTVRLLYSGKNTGKLMMKVADM